MVTSMIAFHALAGPTSDDGVFISGPGLYLRGPNVLPRYTDSLTVKESEQMIVQLFQVLRVAGLVQQVMEPANEEGVPGYQVPASALIWRAGDGKHSYVDPIRVPQQSEAGSRPNPFFVDFYRNVAPTLQGYEAREHTAQVPNDERQQREERFRTAELPILYCSPTMELGVDISQLNAVNMRNIPPTPANYPRSGPGRTQRATGLVFSYCARIAHDQHADRPNAWYGEVAARLNRNEVGAPTSMQYGCRRTVAWVVPGDVLDVEGQTPRSTYSRECEKPESSQPAASSAR